jgi:arylformamidase
MTQICEEAVAQVRFLSEELQKRGHSEKIIVCGISTGAQLMACTLGMDVVVGGLLMSGIYDLEPIRISSLNAPIKMDWAEARQWSPLHNIPASVPPVVIAHGADERPEICRQSLDYHAALQALGHQASLVPVAKAHHFSILDTLIDGKGAVAIALKELAAKVGMRTPTKPT